MTLMEEVLVCPCDAKSALDWERGHFICKKVGCRYRFTNVSLASTGDIPVLVNIEKCDTVLDDKNIGQLVYRKGSFSKKLKSLLFDNEITKNNLEFFISEVKKSSKRSKPRVLVVGGGEIGNSTTELYMDQELELLSFDIYASASTNIVADAHYMPFVEEGFDGVLIQAVLEHVVEPSLVVEEIYRVLQADGVVYSETPFLQAVHEGAYDFTRFTVLGHRNLFNKFEMISCGPLNGIEASLPWMLKQVVVSILGSKRFIKVLSTLFFLALKPLRYIEQRQSRFDSCAASYFLGRKSMSTISQKDLIKLYKNN